MPSKEAMQIHAAHQAYKAARGTDNELEAFLEFEHIVKRVKSLAARKKRGMRSVP